jgi:SAM-dependent methyltransferase
VPDPKQIVAQSYDQIAERHAAWAATVRTEERARYADLLLGALPEGASVLELGCGAPGPTTRALASRYRLTGVDSSARSVELARAGLPQACFLNADMTALELPAASFDAVAAFYSIIHVPRAEHAALFGRIASWLRPGGLFVAALGARDSEAEYDPNWLGAPMFWSGYDEATGRRLVEAAGLVIQQANVETAEEEGRPVSFLWVVARRGRAPADATTAI